jgi:1,4-dihydroxy-6-naphthoate synthase
MREFSLGFSSCPNDTYIFDALIHQKLDSDIRFKTYIEDVETLNQMALNNELDITKISTHAWFHVLDNYKLLSSGGALGKGCGPMLIGQSQQIPIKGKIALPGKLTTASLLYQMAVPGEFQLEQMPFEKVIPAVMEDTVDAGVIIHESRFTFQKFGLNCLLDLGQWWENTTNALIPLGGIIISNKVDRHDQIRIQSLIRESIIFAEKNPESAKEFIKENAQEMEDEVIAEHIGLYVNDYSKDLGDEGRKSIELLYERSTQLDLLPDRNKNRKDQLFIE